MPFAHIAKITSAAVAAWFLCASFITDQAPVFAGIAAVMVVQPSIAATLSRAVERSLGVILGVVVASVVAVTLETSAIATVVTIVIAVLIPWAIGLSVTSSVQVPISAMLVVAFATTMPGYETHRIIETIVGASVGVGVNAIPTGQAKRSSV